VRLFVVLLLISCCGPAASAVEPLIPAIQDQKLIYLDKTGRVSLSTDYKSGGFFQDGMARVCGAGCGYIDHAGSALFGFDYDWIGEASEGLIPFCQDSRCGFLDIKGETVIPPQFEDVQPFSEGLAGAQKNGLWGFVDKAGNWRIRPTYGRVLPFSENRAAVQSVKPPHLFALIDKSGHVVLPFKHQMIYPFQGGRARFFHWDRFGYLNLSGAMELHASLEWAQDPVSGLSYFVHEAKQGYRAGNRIVLELKCPGGQSFSAEAPVVARVRDCGSGLFQFIKGDGSVWKSGYAEATDFRNGYALVRRPDEPGFVLIDAGGDEFDLDAGIMPAW